MTDRRKLAAEQPPKPSKWPRTIRRRNRIEQVINRRQPDLTVVLENVHDPHNASAVLRSCDAVGILRVCLVYTIETPPEAFAPTTSGSAAKWIEVERYDSITLCYASLRSSGFSIYSTAIVNDSCSLYEIDFSIPIAIVFGNEMRGLSEDAVELSDGSLTIPMMGMVQSLNISVACAVALYEALRQRKEKGMYEEPRLSTSLRRAMIDEWLKR
jgi:tRNA (guanosine-2'-O-)-methyltransferase